VFTPSYQAALTEFVARYKSNHRQMDSLQEVLHRYPSLLTVILTHGPSLTMELNLVILTCTEITMTRYWHGRGFQTIKKYYAL
jgi:hypothetical protein